MYRAALCAGRGTGRAAGRAPWRGARAVAGQTGPGAGTVLDEKAKAEIRGLHAADPGRWTAAALAARYGAPAANVAAIVRLAALRTRAPSDKAAAVEAAWIELAGRSPVARGRARAPVRRFEPREQAAPAGDEAAAKGEEEKGEEEEDDETVADAVGTTKTAVWAKERIAEGEVEVVRRTTYAFIEVGKGIADSERAVWLRDGRSGKLREPSLEERRRILGQRRV